MLDEKEVKGYSKFLSYVLRHAPETIGIQLDTEGWVAVDELLEGARKHGTKISREALDEIVANNDKKRFAFDATGTRIRASQGHSVEVSLGYAPQTPPDWLYHGTVEASLGAIKLTGLQKISRHHVHLSKDEKTAIQVGGRRGKPLILKINSAEMSADGYLFYCSENGVWLTDEVPVRYIVFPK